jgi:hypothetical protein
MTYIFTAAIACLRTSLVFRDERSLFELDNLIREIDHMYADDVDETLEGLYTELCKAYTEIESGQLSYWEETYGVSQESRQIDRIRGTVSSCNIDLWERKYLVIDPRDIRLAKKASIRAERRVGKLICRNAQL